MKINETCLKMIMQDENILRGKMEAYGIPGMGMTVVRGGEPVYTGVFGVRDDVGHPVESDTLFECASLTKSLFATLCLRLADAGCLHLDQPIAEQYNHEHWSLDPRYVTITPRQALSHGTGLPGWAPKPMNIAFDPGTSFSYSGEGYYLLQHMVEQLEGRPMEDSFRVHFYEPWSMENTAADWTPEVGAQMSWGYGLDGTVCKIRSCHDDGGDAPEPNAAWSLYSTTADYARFLCHMMKERGGLSEKSFCEMTSVQNQADHGVSWGLGFGKVNDAPDVLWHWGDNGGFKNFSVWDKETCDGVVIFTNSDSGMDLYMDVLKELTDGTFYDDVRAFIEEAE